MKRISTTIYGRGQMILEIMVGLCQLCAAERIIPCLAGVPGDWPGHFGPVLFELQATSP